MRKLIVLLTALLLPLFAFEMSADEEKAKMQIHNGIIRFMRCPGICLCKLLWT